MRKTLSFLLCVVMILSVCSFAIPASAAPEGTAINTADEFLAMVSTPADSAEITAKYYLAADITLPSSYAEPFWGILDGNGHTVTVSTPMFNDFSGEVKNLTIKGEISLIDTNGAAFAVVSTKGIKAENVTNNANVTVSGAASLVAGFIAEDKATQTDSRAESSTYTNVVNNGEIYLDAIGVKSAKAAGIVAAADSAIFTGCKNTGKVTSKGGRAMAGGIAVKVVVKKGTNNAEAYNCINTGEITSVESYFDVDGVTPDTGASETAGIITNVGVKGNVGTYRVWGCVNTGNINGTYRTAGMVGYCYGSKTDQFMDMQFCINTGVITYGRTASNDANIFDWCSAFVGYTNTQYTTIKHNIDIGSYVHAPNAVSMNPGMSFFGCSSADVMICDIQDNYILHKELFTYYTYASSDDNAAQRHTIDETTGVLTMTLDDVKSGKIAYEINTAAAADEFIAAEGYAFYQTLGTDEYPTVDNTHGVVSLVNGAYVNGEQGTTEPVVTEPAATEPEATEPEATEPEATEPEATDAPADPAATNAPVATDAPSQGGDEKKGGCGGFVAGGVALVAILGTALISKKRD